MIPGKTTTIWGYNGITPGPVIKARTGRRVQVTQTNNLPENMTVHLHGGHTPSSSDGGPVAYVPPGTSFNYVYPNNQIGTMLWYHDHAMDLTGAHVYKGLAAVYVLQDDFELGLPLPSGSFDVPLVIQDKTFNADGSLCYVVDSSAIRQGFQGDSILVNGAIQPKFQVAQHKYRFRILNGSNSRQYQMALSNGDPMVQIASDGGLLQAPVSRTSANIAPAEREEFVIDFAKYPIGTQIVLNNQNSFGSTAQIMRFDVTSASTDTSSVPATLRTIPKLDPSTAVVTRRWSLSQNNGVWVINNKAYDPNRIDAQPKLGTTEIWEFNNQSGEDHPMHMHDIQFQILDENGSPPPAYEAGWKDTVLVKGRDTVRVIAQFLDNTGVYVFHCHNLEHEDHALMGAGYPRGRCQPAKAPRHCRRPGMPRLQDERQRGGGGRPQSEA
jgi:FtsP/CotA-like multicopper oxidase with cupredoxin domain